MAGAADRRQSRGPCHACYKRCRTCCAILFGLVFLALGFMASVLYFHFTPLYTKIKCTLDPLKVKKVSFRGGFNLNLNLSTTCHNPNPYRVQVDSLEQEAVFLGRGMEPAATVLEMPHALLPADGWGSVNGILNIRPTRKFLPHLMTLLRQGEVPLYLENKKLLTLHINFIVARFRIQLAFNKACAANVRLLGLTKARLGPPACGNNFGDLELPSVRIKPERGSAPEPVWPLTRGEQTIQKAELAKNALFGILMCICYSLGLLCMCVKFSVLKSACLNCCCCCCCCCACCHDDEEGGDDDEDLEFSSAASRGCTKEDAASREKAHAPPPPPPPPPLASPPPAAEMALRTPGANRSASL